MTRTIPITTASRSYECVIGEDLLAGAAQRIGAALHGIRHIHIFTDTNLPPALPSDLTRYLVAAGFRVSSSPVHPSEEGKTLQTLYHMLQPLAAHNLERRDAVLALGGGIVGDMAGFAAASYRRGIPWINCPTTLLSMVDASVGGKTGVNLRITPASTSREQSERSSASTSRERSERSDTPAAPDPSLRSGLVDGQLQKNMIGAFWQPALVLADVSTLASLDDRTFRAGLAECFKHAMLSADWGDEHLMLWTKEHLAAILEREPAALTELIARNVAIKAKVVGTDEREESTDPSQHGGRAALNLGHTFGHAIETLPMVSPGPDASLAPLHHGEAVALGLICAARCAELLKLVGDGLTESLRLTLGHAGLPTAAHHLPGSSEIHERMGHDKKAAGGKMRLVLPCGEAKCKVVTSPPEELVLQAIDSIRP